MKIKILALAVGLTLAAVGGVATAQVGAGAGDTPSRSGKGLERLLQRVDLNKDGRIAAAEAEQVLRKRFDRLDKDHSGAVSRDEFLQMGAKANIPAARLEKRKQALARRFDKIDRNGNGQADFQEFLALAQDRFAAADTNRDGSLSREEIAAAGRSFRRGQL